MFYEIVRALVQKIFQDKILFALVIIGFLAIFVGGFGGGSSERVKPSNRQAATGVPERQAEGKDDNNPEAQAPAQKPTPPAVTKLEPRLAKDFVRWWLSSAMDYNMQSAVANHQSALAWMTPEASAAFQSAFWTPDIASAVASGSLTGGFTPTTVEAVASNPDGTVVVTVTGHLMLHKSVQQVAADFLIRKEPGGLRIAGMYNRSIARPGSSVY